MNATERNKSELNTETILTSSSSLSSRQKDSVSTIGTTLYIRKLTGTTLPLSRKAGSRTGVPVLVESSYGDESKLFPDGGHTGPSGEYPNLVTIAGGVGIIAVLPILSGTQSLHDPIGTRKLFWGVRAGSESLVTSVRQMITSEDSGEEDKSLATGLNAFRWGNIDVNISIGDRLDIRGLLEAELAGNKASMGTTVFVCGPPGMADEVRNVVSGLARHGTVVRYVEEAFAW